MSVHVYAVSRGKVFAACSILCISKDMAANLPNLGTRDGENIMIILN